MLVARSATFRCTWKRFMASGSLAAWLAGLRRTACSGAGAAVFGEVGEQCVHLRVVGAYPDDPSLALVPHQPRRAQHVQVRGERGRWQVEVLAQLAHGQAFRPGLDEPTESTQAGFVAEGAQRGEGGFDFHNSKNMEIELGRQAAVGSLSGRRD